MRYIHYNVICMSVVKYACAWSSSSHPMLLTSIHHTMLSAIDTNIYTRTHTKSKSPSSTILLVSTSLPHTDRAESAEISSDTVSPYLIHNGRAVAMIKRCVSVEGLSLSRGWTPQATHAFKLAIEAVVRANPILTGKLIEKKKNKIPWSQQSELWIEPNVFPPESHSFVTEVDPNGVLSPSEIVKDVPFTTEHSTQELFEHVQAHLAPHMLSKAEFSTDQIKEGRPLFEAKILDFGDGMSAYSIKMSHAIGDGTTFFQLVSQISSFMNGREPCHIDWNNPLKASHEIYPESFSERDYTRSYGLPFGWGLLKNVRTLFDRKCKYILLSKDKIAKKKQELKSMNKEGPNISANDIIMSAVCETCGSSDLFAFDRSVRGIKEGVPKSAAGNFFCEIPFDRKEGTDPFVIRNIIDSKEGYFGHDKLPLEPFLDGRVGRITSLASVTHQANFPGAELLCMFPSASFIQDLPLDVAVIFTFDSNHWGIMHNFRKVSPSPLLDEIAAYT